MLPPVDCRRRTIRTRHYFHTGIRFKPDADMFRYRREILSRNRTHVNDSATGTALNMTHAICARRDSLAVRRLVRCTSPRQVLLTSARTGLPESPEDPWRTAPALFRPDLLSTSFCAPRLSATVQEEPRDVVHDAGGIRLSELRESTACRLAT